MPTYTAPLDDIRFILNEVLDLRRLAALPGFESVDTETVNAMLGMVAQYTEEVLTPLNASGDAEGCIHDRETRSVRTPKGFKEAYTQFCQNGLTTISCDPAYGGMGWPILLNTVMGEMFCSSNMSFAMYPGLSHGAYNALAEYGTDELKQKFLPKLVTGEWTGTMCLTEPQCGTDLGLIKTKASRRNDDSYSLTGTKIFISAGEHDLADNIVHLVLARIDEQDTPDGIKGISLFIVPKFLEDGTRNPVFCNRIEEKMGIHANSTCEMSFEGAKGWLVGDKHKGMRAMFVMMNEARLGVGLQGLGISEVAYQNALAYALDRVQSSPVDKGKDAASATIIHHPDVRKDLLTMKSQAEGARMLIYWTAMQLDIAHKSKDKEEAAQAQKCVDFLTPVIKAHLTDNAEANSSAAIQVFGGHGYIREHGMEQFYRDARITRLYEGTNGIQALDLIMRKTLLSREGLSSAYLKQAYADLKAAKAAGVDSAITRPAKEALCLLQSAIFRLKAKGLWAKLRGRTGPFALDAATGAGDFLNLASQAAMGHMWVKMATVATQRRAEGGDNAAFYGAKLETARFYMARVLPRMYYAYKKTVYAGADTVMALDAAGFARGQTTVGERPWPPAA